MFNRIFLNEIFLLSVICLNALVIFVQGFYSPLSNVGITLEVIDNLLTIVFVLEAYFKIQSLGFRPYFSEAWNIFDFSLVVIALPSLIMLFTSMDVMSLDFLLTMRILRVFKFFRVLKFVPNVEHLLAGVLRAVKSSIIIILAFFIFNFIFAVLSYSFYSEILPEYFSNPLLAFYSTFKVFTIEGWYEIPDMIAEKSESVGMAIFTRIYFVALLFGGGIFGLSLINSIFVDSMMSDNNDVVLERMDQLEEKINRLLDK